MAMRTKNREFTRPMHAGLQQRELELVVVVVVVGRVGRWVGVAAWW
jgi:hypothetical protein